MEEYGQYLLRSTWESQFEKQLATAREAADSKYPRNSESQWKSDAERELWSERYSFFETASWPEEFARGAVVRDALTQALQTVSKRENENTFFAYAQIYPGRFPLIDGYEGYRSNSGISRTFVYWQILRSGLAYQRFMNDQKRLIARHAIDYVGRAIDSLVRYYSVLEMKAPALRARFRVTETKGKGVDLPWHDPIDHHCELDELVYHLARPRAEWNPHKRQDLAHEVVRDLLQQCGLSDPPHDEILKSLNLVFEECDRNLGSKNDT
jgi:hypothetical protein